MQTKKARNCPGCSSNKARFVGQKNGFDINICTACDSLFTSQLPESNETLNYDDYYSESNLSVPDFIVIRVEEILEGFSSYRKLNRMLDIGFGAGTILDVASKLKWDVFGQEISKPAVEQAKNKGFDVFCGTLSEAKYPDAHFDLITCSEILEHVPDPLELIKEVARILRPGGMFWATTPSARGISFRIMKTGWSVLSPPEHTQLYSAKGVKQMLGDAGFSDVSIKAFGTNPSEIINYFRRKRDGLNKENNSSFDRVETGYELNAKLSGSPTRKLIKGTLNNTLNIFDLGDSLKIYAKK